MSRWPILFAALAALILAQPAAASDRDLCEDEDAAQEIRLAACQRLLDAAPAEDRAEALADIGDVFYETDNWRAAVDYYSRALELDPDHARAVGRRGVANEQIGAWAQAEADLRHRVDLTPDDPWAYLQLARRLVRSLRSDEAIEVLGQAIEIDPGYSWAWDELGFAYTRSNR